MKAVKPASSPANKKTATKASEEIKPDFMTSEKDEVKNAERKLQQNQKKSN